MKITIVSDIDGYWSAWFTDRPDLKAHGWSEFDAVGRLVLIFGTRHMDVVLEKRPKQNY